MPQSLVQLYVHLVFSTKNRHPFLEETAFRKRTHAYLAGICAKQECPSLLVGGTADHVHILYRHSKNGTVAAFVRDLKRDSSKWAKTEDGASEAKFRWQSGYGGFSISPSHVEELKKYIANQQEHHRHHSFKDEFRRLCAKYGLEIDERYVWD